MFLGLPLLAAAVAVGVTSAHPISSGTTSAPLPGQWYHEREHPVHNLFRRQGKRADPSPSIGTPEWVAQYPTSTPSTSDLPQEWVDALNEAIDSGRVPNFPPSTSSGGAAPVYPPGINENRNNDTICAATDRRCRIPGDVWDAPDGIIGIGFDDGPTEFSPKLYDFLKNNSQQSTQYMIGINILYSSAEFDMAYNDLGLDIAVHTWTHPQMTTLSNLDVLAQLAWTLQIIYDTTDGKLPRYWRPPYGDIDARVSAIAREVLGMTAVMWNQDTADWTMNENPPQTTLPQIQTNMEKWLGGPKSPGLIILEHELTNDTIQGFINAWPLIAQNGWKPVSQALIASNATDSDDNGDDNGDDDSDDDGDSDAYQNGDETDPVFDSYIATETSDSSSASASGTLASGSSPSSSGAAAQGQNSGSQLTRSLPSAFLTFGLLVSSSIFFSVTLF